MTDFNSPLNPPERRQPRPSLARLLVPLQAAVQHAGQHFMLELSPMQAIDAFTTWSTLAGRSDRSSTLLMRMPPPACRAGNAPPSEQTPLAAVAARIGANVREAFAPEALLVSDQAVHELITLGGVTDVVAVRIDGPVEESDATAIFDALAAGQSPLDVELRAEAVMEVRCGNRVMVTSRNEEDILRFVADSLRHYLASVRNVAAATLAAPDLGLVHALLDRSGQITVRPLETEVYSTAIDVGVSTGDQHGGMRPADQSLIYDIHSDTWHGD